MQMELAKSEAELKAKEQQITMLMNFATLVVDKAIAKPSSQINISGGSIDKVQNAIGDNSKIEETSASPQTESTTPGEKINEGLKLVGKGMYECLIQEATNKVPFLGSWRKK
ncbi:20224_t:CDS:1 [Funneliformis geosporum]|nr:20224_t:CDS:1 [Funneliformis geosporum]